MNSGHRQPSFRFRKPLDGGAWKSQELVTQFNMPEPRVAEPATVYNTVIYSPSRAPIAEGRQAPSISLKFLDDATPNILQKYVCLAASFVALFFVTYCLSKLFAAVRADVLSLAAQYSSFIKEDASSCMFEYLSNACATASIPAMVDRCRDWKQCSEQNLDLAVGLKLFAEVMADWCNAFVEKITWKTTAFLIIVLAMTRLLVAQ